MERCADPEGRDVDVARLWISTSEALRRAQELRAQTTALVVRCRETRELGRAAARADVDALRSELDGLRKAAETRAVIEQAKGVLMATVGCGEAQAFQLLVVQSQHENRKLREVAADLVAAQQREPTA